MRGVGGGSNRKPEGQKVGRTQGRNSGTPRVVNISSRSQPSLPGPKSRWPAQTLEWWEMWGRSPLAHSFTENDWDELLTAARLHALVWDDETPVTHQLKAASELRQRMSNFGATPLDRQRLRIQLVFADDAEEKQETRRAAKATTPARQRRGPLKAV